MRVQIKYLCSECDIDDPKIQSLFTRERYCGRACWSEGQTRYARMILRMAAEEIDNGELAV